MKDLLEIHKHILDLTNTFFSEEYRQVVFTAIENQWSTDTVRNWSVIDLIPNGDRFVMKCAKRRIPLTDQQLKHKYDRDVELETTMEALSLQVYPPDIQETSKGCFDDMNQANRNMWLEGFKAREALLKKDTNEHSG